LVRRTVFDVPGCACKLYVGVGGNRTAVTAIQPQNSLWWDLVKNWQYDDRRRHFLLRIRTLLGPRRGGMLNIARIPHSAADFNNEPNRTASTGWGWDVYRSSYPLTSDAVTAIAGCGVERDIRKQAKPGTVFGTRGKAPVYPSAIPVGHIAGSGMARRAGFKGASSTLVLRNLTEIFAATSARYR
jgi:hypothetical protein